MKISTSPALRGLAWATTFLFCALLFAGCGNSRRPANGSSSVTTASSTGTVAQLTGDDDSEVSGATQLLVSRAVLLDENDAPLEF